MSEYWKTMGIGALALLLACTPGEAPPGDPGPEGGAEPAAELPGGETSEESGTVSERAASLLTEAQLAYESAELRSALRLARQVMDEHTGTAAAAPARWVAARAAFALGEYAAAGQLAESFAGSQPRGSALRESANGLVELAADARVAPEPAVVGAVLPRSGPRVLVRYADWLLDGIRLAVEEAERVQGRRIELVVADDSGGARVVDAMRELERSGAVAVIGPLLPQHIATAAAARNGYSTVLVSPTATDRPDWAETFSVNASDGRGAQELGRYAADLGFRQAAVLYPRLPEYERKARAFEVEFEGAGGEVRALVPYDSGTTTFAAHMRRILEAVAPPDSLALQALIGEAVPVDSLRAVEPREAEVAAARDTAGRIDSDSLPMWYKSLSQEPFALFVPAPQRDVPQIAPQVAFYGLDSAGVQIFGDDAWASASVRRVVPNRDLEGVLAASNFPPDRAGAAADPDFVRAYEERYRRSFDSSNPLPALGYDAAHLVMQALPNRMLTPRALARRFELLAGIRGATGLLSVRADRVVRTPYLVVIREGELAPAPYPWEYEVPDPVPPATSEEEQNP